MQPVIVDSPAALRLVSERWRAAGLSLGLVPTMGALHAGHRSLLRRARSECDRVVASIFVNPAQFAPTEDLDRYPRTLDADLTVLAEEHIDALLLPRASALYPPGFATAVRVEGGLVAGHEAAARPGHLDGVALVVAKLLVAARADRAYFGQKDAQQCAVVARLAADLDTGTEIVVCPTVRDADGLALSSRNAYLSDEQRAQALAIPAGLAAAARRYAAGDRDSARLRAAVEARLAGAEDLVPDYVDVVDGASFAPVAEAGRGSKIVVAATIGSARLIDTLSLGTDEPPATPRGAHHTDDAHGLEPGVAERSRQCTVP